MIRQFVLMAIGVSIVVTACDGTSKRRVTLKKVDGTGGPSASPNVKTLNAEMGRDKCLRLDKMAAKFIDFKEDMIVYTAGDSVGEFNSDLRQLTPIDPEFSAPALMADADRAHLFQEFKGQDIRKSEAGSLIPTTIDQKCETATFTGEKDGNYEVLNVKPNGRGMELWLRNKANSLKLIRYVYNRDGALNVTTYSPAPGEYCGKKAAYRRTKKVIAMDLKNQNKSVVLDKGLASVLSTYAESLPEFKKAHEGSNKVVTEISLATLGKVRDTLSQKDFKAPDCPKQ